MATGPPHRLPSRAGYPDRRGRAPTSLPVRGAAGDARARCSGHPRLSRTGRDPDRPRGHQCENEYRLRDRKSPFPFCPSVRRLRSALHGAAPAWRRSIRDQPRICPLGSAILTPSRQKGSATTSERPLRAGASGGCEGPRSPTARALLPIVRGVPNAEHQPVRTSSRHTRTAADRTAVSAPLPRARPPCGCKREGSRRRVRCVRADLRSSFPPLTPCKRYVRPIGAARIVSGVPFAKSRQGQDKPPRHAPV